MQSLKKTQTAVTSEEFVQVLMRFMGRSAKDFCADLQKQVEKKWPFESDEVCMLRTQIFIAHLWMVSKTLGPDKRVLDLLHDGYLCGYYLPDATREENTARISAAQSEVWARYEKYYKAWDEDVESKSGMALAFEMSQFFFPKRKPVVNAFLYFSIQTHGATFMASVLDLRKQHEIVDA